MSRPADPERWAEIERLYHAALELEGDQRDSFLREACGDDSSLRQEVLSLLQFDAPGESFLQSSPLEAVARLSVDIGSARIGQRLGPYSIVSFLGAGGMGEVYRATDSRLGRDVAIKVLPENLAQNAEALHRFEREARVIASLSHPNILAIHDFGTDCGVTYAVMELLERETLGELLKRGPLEWRRTVEIAIAIADGLAAAHAKGIVHRDLKPSNVFITSDDRVKILDFGIARVRPPTDLGASAEATQPGRVIGTIGYMSPEQVRGEIVEASSDLFTFGCVLFEMLIARSPFQQGTTVETIASILKEDPPDLAIVGQDIPQPLIDVVNHCLRKDKAQRPESAADVARRLTAIFVETITVAPLRRIRVSNSLAWLAGLALLVALAFAVAFWLQPHVSGGPQVHSIAVLPFKPLSGVSDESLEYGMAETMIMRLSSIREIVVRPFSAVRRYALSDHGLERGRTLSFHPWTSHSSTSVSATRITRLNGSKERMRNASGRWAS